ncbi:unnamed protein product, partial [Polarella glacialis]
MPFPVSRPLPRHQTAVDLPRCIGGSFPKSRFSAPGVASGQAVAQRRVDQSQGQGVSRLRGCRQAELVGQVDLLRGDCSLMSHGGRSSTGSSDPRGKLVEPELLSLRKLGQDADVNDVYKALSPSMEMFKSNPRLVTVLLSSQARESRAEIAEKVLDALRRGRVEVNVFHASAVISACDKGRRWALALSVLGSLLPQRNLRPNAFAYSAAMSACAKGGQWHSALLLLSQMPELKIMPNAVSYNAGISAAEKGGQWQLALCTLRQHMPEVRVAPDKISYNAA